MSPARRSEPGLVPLSDPDDLIRSPERIASILTDLDRHLLLISVRLERDGPLYNSSLVRLDPGRRLLFLDELNPTAAHRTVALGSRLRVFVSLRGIAVRFTVVVEQILLEEGIALYACGYPEELLYLQRREVFRVRLPLYETRTVRLASPVLASPLSGRLIDLSAVGFCLELPAKEIAALETGAVLTFHGMELPEQTVPVSGEAILTNIRPSPAPKFCHAGFSIGRLDPATERALMRAALYYQREARKAGAR